MEQQSWVGRPLDRVDGPAKVTGAARYAAETPAPHLVHAVVVTSTVAKGTIVAADTTAARAVTGVLAVWTPLDAPVLARPSEPSVPYEQPALEVLSPPYYVLQDPHVGFRGQDIGLVIAETSEAARHAASLVIFRYGEEVPALDFSPDAPTFAPEHLLIELPPSTGRGNLEAGLAVGDVIIDRVYETPAEHHNALECGATVAWFEGDKLTVHTTTQDLHGARLCLANSLSLPLERVRVISQFLGGGFGSKNGTWRHTVLAALAARELKRPVRLGLSRQQMFSLHGHRARHRQRIRAAATRDGRLTALAQHIVVQTDTERRFVEHTGEATPMMYRVDDLAITHKAVASNIPAPTIMRAPGAAPGMFALESAIDELAAEIGMDPIAFRLKNDPSDRDPAKGVPWSSKSLKAALQCGAERFGWPNRPVAPRSMQDGRYMVGLGVASATYPAIRLPCAARVRVTANGRAVVEIAATDIGTGTYTILTQIASDALGLAPEAVEVALGDSDLPRTPGSGGSWGAMSYGTAVKLACDDARTKAAAREGEGIAPALSRSLISEVVGEAQAAVPEKPEISSHGFGAHFVEVRVDLDTCEVRVPRMLGVFGVGRALNPKTARSQLIGGMVWGLGMALTEGSALDPRLGHFVNSDLAEYHVPVNADVRDIEAVILDEHDPAVSPLGGKGLGEIGIVGAAAAVANAVFHATGIRVRELPIGLSKLAGLIDEQ